MGEQDLAGDAVLDDVGTRGYLRRSRHHGGRERESRGDDEQSALHGSGLT